MLIFSNEFDLYKKKISYIPLLKKHQSHLFFLFMGPPATAPPLKSAGREKYFFMGINLRQKKVDQRFSLDVFDATNVMNIASLHPPTRYTAATKWMMTRCRHSSRCWSVYTPEGERPQNVPGKWSRKSPSRKWPRQFLKLTIGSGYSLKTFCE